MSTDLVSCVFLDMKLARISHALVNVLVLAKEPCKGPA